MSVASVVSIVAAICGVVGSMLVQVYYLGRFVRGVEALEQSQSDTADILDAHALALENHGTRIAVLESHRTQTRH